MRLSARRRQDKDADWRFVVVLVVRARSMMAVAPDRDDAPVVVDGDRFGEHEPGWRRYEQGVQILHARAARPQKGTARMPAARIAHDIAARIDGAGTAPG